MCSRGFSVSRTLHRSFQTLILCSSVNFESRRGTPMDVIVNLQFRFCFYFEVQKLSKHLWNNSRRRPSFRNHVSLKCSRIVECSAEPFSQDLPLRKFLKRFSVQISQILFSTLFVSAACLLNRCTQKSHSLCHCIRFQDSALPSLPSLKP